MQELINHLKQVIPYTNDQCPEKYMETVMDYIYSEIEQELIK
jgi:hypothetical protein